MPLGPGRILWLFDDSFIAKTSARTRTQAKMIRNCVAIQAGANPSTATIRYYWRTLAGEPSSYFPEVGARWFWPTSGIVTGGKLLLFLMQECRPASGTDPFVACGYDVVAVDNYAAEPSSWMPRSLAPPQNPFGVIVGSASVMEQDGFLYAFGSYEPARHDIYLVRWHSDNVARGDLSTPEWWCGPASSACGPQGQWIAQNRLSGAPPPVMQDAQTEFTVQRDGHSGQYMQIQATRIRYPAGPLAVRWASTLSAPWSAPEPFFTPPESARQDLMDVIYQAKAHPELAGADLIVTYETRAASYMVQVANLDNYFPRFVRLTLGAQP